MYIEDFKRKTEKLEIRQWNAIKWAVFHEKAGCVFLGRYEQCTEYIQRQRTQNKGRNPEIER